MATKEDMEWNEDITGYVPDYIPKRNNGNRIPPRNAKHKGLKYNPSKESLDNKKYRIPANIEFLPCVCGGEPYIYKDHITNRWYASCINCKIITETCYAIGDLRILWNRFCILGTNNRHRIREDYNALTDYFGRRQGLKSREMNREIKKNMRKPRNMEEMRLFYQWDYEYMQKVKHFLKPGQEYVKYIYLCNKLNETPEESPYDRKRHMNWWNRFFEYDRVKQKIVILGIRDDYLPFSGDEMEPNKRRTLHSYRPRPFDPRKEKQRERTIPELTAIDNDEIDRKMEKDKKRSMLLSNYGGEEVPENIIEMMKDAEAEEDMGIYDLTNLQGILSLNKDKNLDEEEIIYEPDDEEEEEYSEEELMFEDIEEEEQAEQEDQTEQETETKEPETYNLSDLLSDMEKDGIF